MALAILFIILEKSRVILLLLLLNISCNSSNEQTFSVLMVCLEVSNIKFLRLRLIEGSKTVDLVIVEETLEKVSVLVKNYSHALLFVIFPCTVIYISSCNTMKNSSALAIMIKGLTDVCISIWKMELSFSFLNAVNKNTFINDSFLSLLVSFKGEFTLPMHSIIFPETIILGAISHREHSFHSHIVMPETLKRFSFTLALTPCHLAKAITLVTSETSNINGFPSTAIAKFLVNQLTLTAEQAISELAHVFIPIGEFRTTVTVQLASLEVPTFCCICLKNVFKLVNELPFKGFIFLKCPLEHTAFSKNQLSSSYSVTIMPLALINISIFVVVLPVRAISLSLHIHAAFKYLAAWILDFSRPRQANSIVKITIYDN